MSSDNLIIDLIFYTISLLTILGSIFVVTAKNIFRGAIALSFVFICVALIFFLLNAVFLGVVQILVYVGAVSVLIAFAVMFIRDVVDGSKYSGYRYLSALLCVSLFILIASISVLTEWRSIDDITNEDALAGLDGNYIEITKSDSVVISKVDNSSSENRKGVFIDSTLPIGSSLISNFLIPFQVIGFILITAIIGSLTIIRQRRN